MKNEEIRELKREMLKEIDSLRREYKSLKNRISVIANMLIPGIGFIIYGSSYLKGIITFALFPLYNLLYFYKILPNLGEIFFKILYYIPAIVIWIVSTVMVGGLDDWLLRESLLTIKGEFYELENKGRNGKWLYWYKKFI